MFGRTVSGFGSRAKRGPAPLSVTVQEDSVQAEIFGAAGSTQQSAAGQIDLTAIPTGGVSPYSFSWSVAEAFDDGNCSVLSAGTQNADRYHTLTFQTVIPSGFPPIAQATYEIRCTVTDSAGTSVQTDATQADVISNAI